MKRILGKALLVLATLACIAQPAYAAPLFDYSAIDNNWYDERGNNVCGSAGSGLGNGEVVNAEDNEKTIFFTLLANGFTKIEAAAILGNLKQESGYDPKAVERGGTGEGRGIAQWGVNARFKTLVDGTQGKGQFAVAKGKDPWDLTTQLQFMFHEFTHDEKAAYKEFKAAPQDLHTKVDVFGNAYERFKKGAGGPRFQFAIDVTKKQFYKDAQENSGGDLNSDVTGSSGGGSCSAAGGASNYIDGFVIYNQYDTRWVSHPYAGATIGIRGCGPSAMAMAITNLTGKSVTPPMVADWAGSRYYVQGQGSSWDIAPAAAQKWGLTSKKVTGVAGISAALRGGALVFIGGTGDLPFTGAGHLILIRAVTEDGKWMVADSAHKGTNTTKFDPQSLLSKTPGYGYAISK